MKKSIKIVSAVALFLGTSFLSVNELKAENNSQNELNIDGSRSGNVLSLHLGSKSGVMQDNITGEVFEFHYAGPGKLEINANYVYTPQEAAEGKIIIRDIQRK